MRYNVYVVTAAQFVADMHATLVTGRSLVFVDRRRQQSCIVHLVRDLNPAAAATCAFNLGTTFKDVPDAWEYARAALRDFQSYGDSAAADIADTEQLLARIEQAIQEQSP